MLQVGNEGKLYIFMKKSLKMKSVQIFTLITPDPSVKI